MKLYVGLGNPGPEYKYTRHNIGFMIIDTLLGKLNINSNEQKAQFKGLVCKTKINNEDVFIFKPLTFMNLSGQAVKEIVDYYKISIDDIVVIHDDMDFELGKFKLKEKGSEAGHNGIKDIIQKLGTQEFKRIRIGIGRTALANKAGYVLGKLNNEELEVVKDISFKIADALIDFTKMDFNKLMTKYNKRDNNESNS
ncbi:MAG: aminoacyl-tRNA hydrolase [Bacilli bacterium]|nr:aminoacyl-tRNA hydrolase [Bacilli bacterium]MDD4584537.1 aminoacyl-tRNA hydrolase [Bacilli bacterium]